VGFRKSAQKGIGMKNTSINIEDYLIRIKPLRKDKIDIPDRIVGTKHKL
jgi:hypothetical protein